MQSPPAWEAMYLHGILHRIEGDIDNARAWYRDVKDGDVFKTVWSDDDDNDPNSNTGSAPSHALDRANSFLDKVESYKASLLSSSVQNRPAESTTSADTIRDMSLHELRRVLSFCETKFGTDPVTDVSDVWVSMADKHKDQAAQMITSGEGWREF